MDNVLLLLCLLCKREYDYDLMDFINTGIMSFCMLIVGMFLCFREFFFDSVQCKIKPHWDDSWLPFVQRYCYFQGSTFTDFVSNFDSGHGIASFQWISIMIVMSACLYHVPRLYWSIVNSYSHHFFPDVCLFSKFYISRYYHECLKQVDTASYYPRNIFYPYYIQLLFPRSIQGCVYNHYLTICYLMFKLFQIINNFAIHWYLCSLLTQNANDPFGLQSVLMVINGNKWETTGLFPRIMRCSFEVLLSAKGYNQQETTLCYFKSNVFFERFFVIFFIASLCLFLANLVNLFYWLIRLYRSYNFLETLVKHNSEIDFSLVKNKYVLIMFCQTLSFDCRFVLMMINFDAAEFSAKFFYRSFIQKNATAKAVLEASSPEKAKEIFENYLNEI